MEKDPRFPPTQWELVVNAGAQSAEAMEKLCRTYWYPLYAFLRRQGYSGHDAEDYTQGFLAECVEKCRLGMADQARGKFRSFLLVSLRNYVSKIEQKQGAVKRGGNRLVSLDEQDAQRRYDQEACRNLTPEQLFERQWALTVLDQAMAQLQKEYDRDGQSRVFELLRVFLTGEKATSSYPEIAKTLHISEGAVRVAVHRLRQNYGTELRAVVSQSLCDPQDVDDELNHLLSALSY